MNSLKESALKACRTLIKPVIKILLRNGISFREFLSLCKTEFVQTAEEEFGINNRPANISRIAIVTGLDRKEIKRIKEALANSSTDLNTIEKHPKTDRATRVLAGWHTDSNYLDKHGKPLILPLSNSDNAPNLTSLVRQYAGDVPTTTLIKELKRCGTIDEIEPNKWQALKRHYIPSFSDPESLERAGTVIGDVSNTLYHNLYSPDKAPRFERRATSITIPTSEVPAFYELLAQEGQAFLVLVDNWLSEHEKLKKNDSNNKNTETTYPIRLGVGVYCIEENLDGSQTK